MICQEGGVGAVAEDQEAVRVGSRSQLRQGLSLPKDLAVTRERLPCASRRGLLKVIVWSALLPVLLSACGGEDQSRLPAPIQLTPNPSPVVPTDPAFSALEGARAYYGELNGGAYQIEIPNNWNRQLIMYLHGSR